MKVAQRLSEWFFKNPLAWLLLGLFLLAEHGNYTGRQDLSRVCELLGEHTASYENPTTPRQEIDTICNRHAPDDQPENP